MTEDRSTDGILLQGGHWVDGNDGDFLADTWRWSDGAWLEVKDVAGPGPRVNSPGAWDDRLGGIVMFGGGTGLDAPMGADTWRWTEAWSEMSPASGPTPRNGHALAFDVKRGVLVLVGGIARSGRLASARRVGAGAGRLASGMATPLMAHPSSRLLSAARRSRQKAFVRPRLGVGQVVVLDSDLALAVAQGARR